MNLIPLLAVLLGGGAVLPQTPDRAPQVQAQDSGEAPRVTLALQDTDIRDALRMIAKQGKLNLVMSNKVTGTISVELSHTSLHDALEAIVKIGGFEYAIDGNIITVASLDELRDRAKERDEIRTTMKASPPAREARVFQLRYIDAERVTPVIEKLLGEGGTVTALKTPDLLAHEHRVAEIRSAAVDEHSLKIGSRLASTTEGQPAKSHTLVVVDSPERLAHIQEILRGLDVKPAQVLIEARFVEISLDDAHKLGIDWNVAFSATGASAPHTFPFGDSNLGRYGPHTTGSTSGGVFPDAPNSVTTPSGAGLFTFGTLDFTTFSAVLQMIQSDSRLKVVSNPRIVVGDRQTATILVGERYPILSAAISQYGNVTETLDHYEPIGVQLEVTPSVLGKDDVELFVRPSTSSLGEPVVGSSGFTVARINTRQIDTSVTAHDCQTVVLGGLITSREEDVNTQVPFLGDIPLVGKLFSHKSKTKSRVDLVIFLTVTLLDDGSCADADRALPSGAVAQGVGPNEGHARSALRYSPSSPKF